MNLEHKSLLHLFCSGFKWTKKLNRLEQIVADKLEKITLIAIILFSWSKMFIFVVHNYCKIKYNDDDLIDHSSSDNKY